MSIRRFKLFLAAITATALSAVAGCSRNVPPNTGPSYADLVTIYNAELSALDRLEKKKEELIEEYESARRPSGEDALKAIGDLLTSGEDSTGTTDADEPLDPNVALDRAVEQAQDVQDTAKRLLESLGGASSPNEETVEAQPNDSLAENFKTELESLEAEIEKQRKRVDQARKSRDEAEATLR
jgi:hypothetical protein